ncbi:hypothetical protein GWK47_020142 [Chionoecetes opilio]|uniref:Uncharacterized protein n=1 Tax=Chionoecetes opilio TaxID=41210 RepID=A0A8J5CHN8_CHIOP|nr:hypothetical protein GWK47_020142 [Chionoecetes opilio]
MAQERAGIWSRPAAHGQSPARRCEQATQTLARTYTFQEADLVDLLITYDHLVCQETAALEEKFSHEPALSLVRRLLREGKPLPRTLPTARPLNRRIHFYDHVGEKDRVQFTDDQQTADQDTIDDALLLLDEDRDLTDDEMARLLGQQARRSLLPTTRAAPPPSCHPGGSRTDQQNYGSLKISSS